MGKKAKQKPEKAQGKRRSTPVLQHSSTPSSFRRPAVFIDRDGTLNEMVYDETHGLLDSPRRPEQARLVKGAAAFVRGVGELGFTTVVVTNQPGVAKGTMTLEEVYAVNRRVARLLAAEGAAWDDIRFCPHHPKGKRRGFVKSCSCRKPKPGMLTDAAGELGLSLKGSWMVGDGLSDMQAGRRAGCRTILVTKLKLDQVELFFELKDARPHFITRDLKEALAVIRKGT